MAKRHKPRPEKKAYWEAACMGCISGKNEKVCGFCPQISLIDLR
jgi:hypothetical protein